MSKNGLWLVLTALLFLPAVSAIGAPPWPVNTSGLQQKSEQGSGAAAPGPDEHLVDWENAPRVDLVCRTFSAGLHIMWNILFPSYLLFWPIREWKSSGLVVVLDGESPGDHAQGTILQHLALSSMVRVKYEAPPPKGTLCSNWRSEGYSRQQYSNFYAEMYTDAEFVAIADTDSAFQAPALPSDLFEDGKPIVRGFNLQGRWGSKVTEQAVGGRKGVGSFMNVYSFPVVLRASDMPRMRAGIADNLGAATFEEAFQMICSKGATSYSQFDIILNYMWYYMRDSYAWHIADIHSGTFDGVRWKNQRRATENVDVLSKNVPTVLPMRHRKGIDDHSIGPSEMYGNLCSESDYQAGSCEAKARRPHDGAPMTGMWTAGNVTWRDTYHEHLRQVAGAHPAFAWRPEISDDWIYPGGN